MPSKTAMVLSARRASLRGARGDPIFGALIRGFTKLARPIFRGVKALATRGSKTALVLRSPQTGKLVAAPAASLGKKILRGVVTAVGAGALFESGGRLFDSITGADVGPARRKRMNVLNPRALSRATRRLAGFNRRSKAVEKQLRKLCPPSRRRSFSPPHRAPVHPSVDV